MDQPTVTFPVDTLSYSGLTQLLRNPLMFKLKQVLGIYDERSSVSRMIGNAGHEALRFYYGGDPDRPVPANRAEAIAEAKATGLKYIADYPDGYIDYGKTGSREKIIEGYNQAMQFYFEEEPTYHEVLFCEDKLSAAIKTKQGQEFPLPATCRPDLIVRNEDASVDIIDTKFTTKFTDYETEDYIKIVQAKFIEYVLRAQHGVQARRCIFREIKRSKNSGDNEGLPQIRDYVIPLDHEPYDIMFVNLYRDVVAYLGNNPIFLPNLSDQFDGEHSGMMYLQGLTTSDMSDVEVMHKVRDVARVTKKFVASRLDREENQNLVPEERVRMALWDLGIPVEPVDTKESASVTQYRFKVAAGVRMANVKKHKDDIARALKAEGEVRILAPIPGTDLIGVEIEKKEREAVKLEKRHFQMGTFQLPIGVAVDGTTHYLPLTKAPHVLIAGASGSGKSVLMHTLLTGLTTQKTAEELELVLIDPKRVELAAFARKPHLHGKKVIFEQDDALRALLELVDAMDERYHLLEKAGKSDIEEFNASKRNPDLRMRTKVLVIDEFADLMMRAKLEKNDNRRSYNSWTKGRLTRELSRRGRPIPNVEKEPTRDTLIAILEEMDARDATTRPDADVELLVVRLAQMGRAAGIHLIVATQRPSTDVITGLIKANFPTRIALTAASATDSKVVLDVPGAEKLAGAGDMLYRFPALRGDVRLQGFSKK